MDHEVEQVLEQSYTVRQLIKDLQDCDLDARVLFVCNYGDYHSTQQALPFSEITEHESDVLRESGYSQSGIAFTDPDEGKPDEDAESEVKGEDEVETCPVVILQH